MATIYDKMLKADIPEHLMLHIAEKVHSILMKDSLQKIKNRFSIFEKVFREEYVDEVRVLDVLANQYPDLTIHVQNDFQCYRPITVVLKMNKTRFVVFHEYKEYTTEQFLMEGEFKDGVYIMERFIKDDIWRDEVRWEITSHKSIELYQQKKNINHIPFDYLHFVMSGTHKLCSMESVRFRDSVEKQCWFDHAKMIDWFIDNNEIWLDYADDE